MSGGQKAKSFDMGVLRRIVSFTRPYRSKLLLAVFLSIFLAILAPVRPMLIQTTINAGLREHSVGRFLEGAAGFIIEITIIQIALLLFESFCRIIFTFSTASLGQNVVKDIRTQTYDRIIHLKLRQFDRTPIGTLTTRTINDIESINEVFSDGLIPIIADLLSIISILIYMFSTSWEITLVCLAPFPLLILGTYWFKETVNKSFIRVRNAVSALNTFVQEHLSGINIVQAFAAEGREQEKFDNINKEHRNANIKAIFAYSVFFPFVELISAVSIGLLVWWAASRYGGSTAEEAANIGGIITSFILCINLLFRPLRMLADKFNVLQMGVIAGERVFKVLDNDDITSDAGTYHTDNLKGAIEFRNVNFSYKEGVPVLKDISFKVEPGETLAIVGSTGSGKTSVINLLNRLYEIDNGQILVDGRNIYDYKLTDLRSRIAVVLQDVFLFNGSIMENVTLRNPEIKKEQVVEAAKMIGMHDFIMRLPGDYDYNVRERGATLSMGQRQLLSFIRAILYNPAILILDEATSSIDSESEQLIQAAIEKLVHGRTAVVIAHRLSTIKNADQIMVLDKGKILEIDSHAELMKQEGAYQRLYDMQFEKR